VKTFVLLAGGLVFEAVSACDGGWEYVLGTDFDGQKWLDWVSDADVIDIGIGPDAKLW
jgi:hypothetical protein